MKWFLFLSACLIASLGCRGTSDNPTTIDPFRKIESLTTSHLNSATTISYGMITTQVLKHVPFNGAIDSIITTATVQLLDSSGIFIKNFEFQPSGDPYPGYWRCDSVDTAKTYIIQFLTEQFDTNSWVYFSCLTAQYGVEEIYGNRYLVVPSDFVYEPVWGEGQAYPRQFYVGFEFRQEK
ncbi:MAG: hypothetical protein E6K56_10720 [Ignavibacteria bacterium]|nr:MAG: hypothetical protein E6K56_10720 [Ignavibacteria bacterium]